MSLNLTQDSAFETPKIDFCTYQETGKSDIVSSVEPCNAPSISEPYSIASTHELGPEDCPEPGSHLTCLPPFALHYRWNPWGFESVAADFPFTFTYPTIQIDILRYGHPKRPLESDFEDGDEAAKKKPRLD
jgi:hypothetical protein